MDTNSLNGSKESPGLKSHLEQRGMDTTLYPYMGIEEDVAAFPMYDFGGRLTGVYYYRPSGDKKANNDPRQGKYFSKVTKERVALFGLESWNNPGPLFLTGGLFKAATLHRLGYAAANASLVSYKYLRPQLALLGRKYYSIGDNDPEGATFATRYRGWQSPVDVDEMSDAEVHQMIYERTGYRHH